MNDGIKNCVVTNPFTKPMPTPNRQNDREHQVDSLIDNELREDDRQEAVHRPDREVELACDQEERESDGHDP
jgi:hypothetical protein